MWTRSLWIAPLLLAGCGISTEPPYNPTFGDAPPVIDRTNHGDYLLVGSAEALVDAHDADGTPRGTWAYEGMTGPEIELVDRFDRSYGFTQLDQGRVEVRRRTGGTFRMRMGDRETQPADIWDGNPSHTFEPFRFASFGKIDAVPNPAPGPTTLRFPTGGFLWTRLVVEGDPAFGSPVRFRRTLFDDQLDAGDHAFVWDGRDAEGDPVPPGLYRARVWVSTMGWLWHEYLVVQ